MSSGCAAVCVRGRTSDNWPGAQAVVAVPRWRLAARREKGGEGQRPAAGGVQGEGRTKAEGQPVARRENGEEQPLVVQGGRRA